MILFITRKHPPVVGGMEQLSYRLTTEIGKLTETRVIAWRRRQTFVFLFLPLAFLQAAWLLLKDRHNISVLHIGDAALAPLGLILKTLFRVPTAITLHGLDVVFANPFYQSVIPFCLRKMDRLFCISSYARDEAIQRGMPGERCHVVPVGVDRERFDLDIPKSEARRRLEPTIGRSLDRVLLLVTVGRLVRRKGVAVFVARALPTIVAQHKQVHYLVVGEGPQGQEIERQIATHNLQDKVSLLGKLDDDKLRFVYRAADMFVMPNIPIKGDAEGFGLVALEAAAAGLPVVTADLEGIRDAVTPGENGLLVQAEDWDGFAKTISGLLADEERRRQVGDRAKAFVSANFSWGAIARRYLEVFEGMSRNRSIGEEAICQKWEEAYLGSRRSLAVRQRRIQSFGIPHNSLILDFGCGDGLDLVALDSLGYSDVLGIDNSAMLLSRIRAFTKVQADAYSLPFPSDTFDVVFVNSVLHHLDVPGALAEIRRILTAEGQLCIIEPASTPFRWLLDLATLSPLFLFFSYFRFLRSRRSALNIELPEYRSWLKQEPEFASRLEQAGFQLTYLRRTLLNVFAKCAVKV